MRPLQHSTPLNDSDEHDNNRNNQQDVNEPTNGVRADRSEQPHASISSSFGFLLTALLAPNWGAKAMPRRVETLSQQF